MKTLQGLVLALCLSLSLQAQEFKNFLQSKNAETYWLGIDYSQMVFVGDGFENINESEGGDQSLLKDRFFDSWNELIVNEEKRYDWAKAFRKNKIEHAITSTKKRNQNAKLNNIFVSNLQELGIEKVENYVQGLSFDKNSGYGIIIVMESMDKSQELGTYYLTIINLSNKKILHTEYFKEKAGGFGFRNYWIKPVHFGLTKIQKSLFKKWQK